MRTVRDLRNSDIDKFYENDGSVLDMYSENPAGVDPTTTVLQLHNDAANEGDCYNREHIPQSVFSSASNGFDAHFITPTDGKVNGIRVHHSFSGSIPYFDDSNGILKSTTAGYTGPVLNQ
jgi:hypothetical protein